MKSAEANPSCAGEDAPATVQRERERGDCSRVHCGHRNPAPLFSFPFFFERARDEEARNAIYYLHHSLHTRLKCVRFFGNKSSPREGAVMGGVFALTVNKWFCTYLAGGHKGPKDI